MKRLLPILLVALAAPLCARAQSVDPFAIPPDLSSQAVFSCQALKIEGATIDSVGVNGTGSLGMGHVVSNDNVSLTGHARVNGNALAGPGRTPKVTGGSVVTGTVGSLPALRNCQPVDLVSLTNAVRAVNDDARIPRTASGHDPLGGAGHTEFHLASHDSIVLPGGTYYFTKLDLNEGSTVTLSGAVRILLAGEMHVQNVAFNATGTPFGLRIWISANEKLDIGHGANLRAFFLAPYSEVEIGEGVSLTGAVFGRSVSIHPATLWRAIDDASPLATTFTESGAPLADGALFTRDVRPVFTVAGGVAPLTVTATLDGAAFTSGATVSTEGVHRLTVLADDLDGRHTESSVSFTIDRTPPRLLIGRPAAGEIVGMSPIVVSGTSDDAVSVSVNGIPATVSGGAFLAQGVPLGEGTNSLTATGIDRAGMSGQTQSPVVLDTQPPVLTVTSPSDGWLTSASSVTVAGTAVDPHLARVTVNGAVVPAPGGPFSATVPLVEGHNPITVEATDVVLHVASTSITVDRDSTSPVIQISANGVPLVDGRTYNADQTIVVTVVDAHPDTTTMTLDGSPFTSGGAVSNEASHVLAVQARDKADNTASSTVHFSIDKTAPTIVITTPVPGSNLLQATVVVSGTYDDAVSVTVNGQPSSVSNGTFSTSVTFADGHVSAVATGIDAAGNVGTGTASYLVDTLPPVVAITSPAPNAILGKGGVPVSGTASDVNLTSVTVNGMPAQLVLDGSFTAGPFTPPDGTFPITAVATDAAARSSSASVTVTVDTVPPVIAILDSATGQPIADGQFFNRPVTLQVNVADATTPAQTTKTVLVDGAPYAGGPISSEQGHTVSVTAKDGAENPAFSSVSFTVDTTPPSFSALQPPDGWIGKLTLVAVSGHVSADATQVTVGGVSVPVADGSFSRPGVALTEGDNAIPLQAVDKAGNTGTTSLHLALDTTQPTVTITNPPEGALLSSRTISVAGTASDAHLDTVTVQGGPAVVTGNTWRRDGVALGDDGVKTITASAADRAGNSSPPVTISVTVDTLPPVVTITSPGPGNVLGGSPVTVSGTATDPHLASVTVNGVTATLSGSAFTAQVPLAEGSNTLTATARDTLALQGVAGHEASASVTVTLDSGSPKVTITSPEDGARFRTSPQTVTGTLDSATNIGSVTVNGVPATLSGTTFTASVPLLVEGSNTLTARATKATVPPPDPKFGLTSITVTLDTQAPTLVSSYPAEGQSGVPATPQIRLTFSEPLDPTTVVPAAFSLQDAAGASVAIAASILDAVVTLIPSAPLHDSEGYTLTAGTSLTDLSGNTLAVQVAVHFTTVDVTPPPPPVIDPVNDLFCGSSVTFGGSAEPASTISVTGGSAAAQGTTSSAGRFSVVVLLAPDTFQTLTVTARDLAGNASTPVTVSLTTDCTPPQVVDVTENPTSVVVTFTEALAAASVRAGETARLDRTGSSTAPVPATAALSQDGKTLTLSVSGLDLTTLSFQLSLSSGITDRADNALVPFVRAFLPKAISTVLLGEVYDDAIGRPLAGATATLLAQAGQPVLDPKPSATTTADGTFALAALAGDAVIRLSAPGFLDVFRRETIDAGTDPESAQSATMFDVRLTPLAAPAVASPTSTGTLYTAKAGTRTLTLEAASGVLSEGTVVRLTLRRPQGLPFLAPLGWSIASAANVALLDANGNPVPPVGSLTLTLPDFFGAASTTALTLAQLDPVALQWMDAGGATLTQGALEANLSSAGDWAILVPDPAPTTPPDPTLGAPLSGVSLPDTDPLTQATIVANPVDVLPSQTADVGLTVTSSAPIPSGFPVQTLVTEQLTLLDGSTLSAPSFLSDLLLLQHADATVGLSIPVRASEGAQHVALQIGYESLTAKKFPFEVRRGTVVGSTGGTVAGGNGWSVTLPSGAVSTPTSLTISPEGAADLPTGIPSQFDFLGAIKLATGGVVFHLPATVSVKLSTPPPSGRDVLLVSFEEVMGFIVLRPLARATWDAGTSVLSTNAIDRTVFPWPGVLGGGTYAFLSAKDPLAFVSGKVFDVDGTPLGALLVRAAGWPLVAISEGDGTFATAILLAGGTLTSYKPSSGNVGSVTLTPDPNHRELTGIDIHLQVTAPFVAAVSPAPNTTILVGSTFTVTFSEAVDPLSITSDSFFLLAQAGTSTLLVPGQWSLDPAGRVVTFAPSAPLPGNTPVLLVVKATVRDLNGYTLVDAASKLAADFSAPFTTEDLTPPDAKPWLITMSTPSGDPNDPVVTITGAPGAVCGGCHVVAYNDTTLATAAMDADSNGAFTLTLHAKATDSIRIEVQKPNGTKQTLPPVPFTDDQGKTVIVGSRGGTWQTPDGYRVSVPPGAFSDATTVVTQKIDKSVIDATVAPPRDSNYLDSFTMDFPGMAHSGFDLSFPEPPPTANDQFVLAQVVEVFGEQKLMVVDLLYRNNGRLATDRSGSLVQSLRAQGYGTFIETSKLQGVSSNGVFRLTIQPLDQSTGHQTDRPGSFWDGVAEHGMYALYNNAVQVGYVAAFGSAAFGIVTCNASDYLFHGEHVIRRDTFRLVVPVGRPFDINILDPNTGLSLFQGSFGALDSSTTVTLVNPPVGDDKELPGVLTASPGIVYRLLAPSETPSGATPIPVLVGPKITATSSSASSDGGITVTITGEGGAAPKAAWVKLYNSSAASGKPGAGDVSPGIKASDSDGSFTATIRGTAGDRLTLAIGNPDISPSPMIKLVFDKPMSNPGESEWKRLITLVRSDRGEDCPAAAPSKIELGITPRPYAVDAADGTKELQIEPLGALARGCSYTLHVDSGVTDKATPPNTMPSDFEIDLGGRKVATDAQQTGLGFVRKVLAVGGLLLETGEDNRLHVFKYEADTATPLAGPECVGPTGDPGIPLPGVGRDMVVDSFGRLVLVGGGTNSYGFLTLFDFVDVQNGTCKKTLHAAGAAIVSAIVGGDTLQWPPQGSPRRVSLHQETEQVPFTYGRDLAPRGWTLTAPTPTGDVRRGVALDNSTGEPLGPDARGRRVRMIKLRDLTTGEVAYGRTDAGGRFSLPLERVTYGDRLMLEASWESLALVDVLGYGIAVVDIEAVYTPCASTDPNTPCQPPAVDPNDPNLGSKLILAYDGSGAAYLPGNVCTAFGTSGKRPSCDAAQKCHNVEYEHPIQYCSLFVEVKDAQQEPIRTLQDLLSLTGVVADPRPRADGTFNLFGAVNDYGLFIFNVDTRSRARLPITDDPATPAAWNLPIRDGHMIGLVKPVLLPTQKALDVAFAPDFAKPESIPQACRNFATWTSSSKSVDLAFLAAGVNGVYVVDVTNLDTAFVLGRFGIRTGVGVLAVSVDAQRKLLFASNAGGGVEVFSLANPCGEPPAGTDGDARFLFTLTFGGSGVANTPVTFDPDTGFTFLEANNVFGSSGELDVVDFGPPVYAVADTDLNGAFERVSRIVPLGVKNSKKTSAIGENLVDPNIAKDHEPYTPDHFRVLAFVPGEAGETIDAEVASTSSDGVDLPPSANGFPKSAHVATPIVLRRQSIDPASSAFNRYQSEPLTVLADPRAQLAYQRSDEEKTLPGKKGEKNPNACQNCDVAEDLRQSLLCNGLAECPQPQGQDGRYELWSGARIRVTLKDTLKTKLPYLLNRDLKASSWWIDSVRGDLTPALKQQPVLSANEVLGVSTHSGEYTTSAVDLSVAGRQLAFVADRTLGTQSLHDGPMGRNWDSSLFERLRPLPNGDVDYYDGSSRRHTFVWKKETGKFESPEGIASTLLKSLDGRYYLTAPDRSYTVFDAEGRKIHFWDRHITTPFGDDGNRQSFTYDGADHLVGVADDLGRVYTLVYDDTSGRLSKIKDFDKREVSYDVDSTQMTLLTVTGPEVGDPDPRGGSSVQPITVYSYTGGGSDLKKALFQSSQLETATLGGETPYTTTYGDTPGTAATVQTVDGTTQFETDGQPTRTMKVTEPSPKGAFTVFVHDDQGHVTTYTDQAGKETRYTYETGGGSAGGRKDGLLGSVRFPLGDSITYTYDNQAQDRRKQFNLTQQTRTSKDGTQSLVTTIEGYESHNLPTLIRAPDGSTSIQRDSDTGDPIVITSPGIDAAQPMVLNLTPDQYGRVKQKSGDGRTEIRQYDDELNVDRPTGQVKVLSVTGGASTTYDRDHRGNVTGSFDTSGNGFTSSYHVDNLDQVTSETRGGANQSVTTYAYDAAGQVEDRSTLTGYDTSQQPPSSIVSNSHYGYDSLGRLTLRSSSDAGSTQYYYDSQGNLDYVVGPKGTTDYVYVDPRPLLTGIRSPSAGACTANNGNTESFTYDDDSVRITATNCLGGVTTYILDGFERVVGTSQTGRATSSGPINAMGRVPVTMVADPTTGNLYRWTVREFDLAGRVTKEIRKLFPNPDPNPTAIEMVTQTTYDQSGRVIQVTDPYNRTTFTTYDDAGRVSVVTDAAQNEAKTDYYENGNRWHVTIRERQADGTYAEFVTTYTYDDQNRVTDVYAPGGRRTHYEYDLAGRTKSETDPDGGVTSFEYDLAGRKTKETDPLTHVTQWQYDAAGNLVLLTDPTEKKTSYKYDDENRLIRETRGADVEDLTTPHWEYGYDGMGNRTIVTDPNGTTVTYTYDPWGQPTGSTIQAGQGVVAGTSTTITPDLVGRVLNWEKDFPSGAVIETASYDSLDRVTSESVKIGTGPTRTTTKNYDSAGNTELLYPSGRDFVLAPDPLDRLKTIEQVTSTSRRTIVGYDDIGSRQVKRTLGNGFVETRAYDPATAFLRTLSAGVVATPSPALSLEYSNRNGRGLKLDVVRYDRNLRDHFEYDAASRITKEETGLPPVPPSPPAVATPDVRTDYTIDGVLNILRRDRTQAGVTVTTNATIDGTRNELTQWGPETLTYDPNGNLLTGFGMVLSYDEQNRVVKATLPNGDSQEFLRDADGRTVRRTLTTSGTVTATDVVQTGDQVIEEYAKDGTVPTAGFVHGRGIDEIVEAQLDPTASGTPTTFIPIQDELGNVHYLTDQSGNVLEKYTYEGYGKFRVFDPQGNPLSTSAYGWNRLFQGREYLPLIDAYDFRARVLFPEIGRFAQEDPAGVGDSPNRYQALKGAWTEWTDPSGQFSVETHEEITREAAQSLGLSEDLIYLINQGHASADHHHFSLDAQHFDNSEFQAGVDLMSDLHRQFSTTKSPRDAAILFGRFLHAAHDFYAHSNYAEIRTRVTHRYLSETSLPLWDLVWPPSEAALRPKAPGGPAFHSNALEDMGLLSGHFTTGTWVKSKFAGQGVWLEERQPTHYGVMGINKDEPDTPEGSLVEANGQSLHFIVRGLAKRQTIQLLNLDAQRLKWLEKAYKAEMKKASEGPKGWSPIQ